MNIMFYATVISTNIDKSDMQYIVCCNLLNSAVWWSWFSFACLLWRSASAQGNPSDDVFPTLL